MQTVTNHQPLLHFFLALQLCLGRVKMLSLEMLDLELAVVRPEGILSKVILQHSLQL